VATPRIFTVGAPFWPQRVQIRAGRRSAISVCGRASDLFEWDVRGAFAVGAFGDEPAILGRLRLRDRRPGKEQTAFLELPIQLLESDFLFLGGSKKRGEGFG
jgi:hypothetical protein